MVLDRLFEGATPLRLAAGQVLFACGDPVSGLFRVREGAVSLLRRSEAGRQVTLQTARVGDVLAKASAWSAHYHCNAEATVAACVLALPLGRFRERLAGDPLLAEGWSQSLARAVQSARLRAGILALRGVGERLDAWLAAGNSLPERGAIQLVAAEIGVTREALYRELSQRRGKG